MERWQYLCIYFCLQVYVNLFPGLLLVNGGCAAAVNGTATVYIKKFGSLNPPKPR